MKKKFFLLVAILTTVTFILASCSCKKTNTTIRLSEVTHSVFYAPLYIAMTNGYFEQEGLKIELTNAGGADRAMTALISNQADIGLMGPEAAIYVIQQGGDIAPKVFGQLTKRDGSFLVGRTANPNFKWSDLEGKEIIAGRRGGVPAMTLEYALNKNNLYDGQNVTLLYNIQFDNMASAFMSGIGDYVTLFEPLASSVVAENQGYILASVGQEAGEVPFTAFMATSNYINKNPEKIKAFLRAVYRGYMFLTTADVEDVVEVLHKEHFKTTSKESLTYCVINYRDIDAWSATPIMSKTAYERLITIMTNAGELTTPVPFEDVVDNSFAIEVMQEMLK